WVRTLEDGLDDLRGQEGQGQEPPDVALVDRLACGELCHRSDLAGQDGIEATIGARDLLEENGVRLTGWRGCSADDQPHLDAAALDAQRKIPRDGERRSISQRRLVWDERREIYSKSQHVVLQLGTIEQGRQRRGALDVGPQSSLLTIGRLERR